MPLNQTLGWTTGITLSYDLFQFGKKEKDIRNAKISLENSQISLEKAEFNINQDFEKAWSDYQLQLQTIQLDQMNLNVEQERYKHTEIEYNLGQSDHLTFRDAQLSLARSEDQLFDAQINAKLAELELLRLSGLLLK